jgi:hypothetical protein
MEIEEIDDHTLDGVAQRVATEAVVGLREAEAHVVEILAAYLLLARCEAHDGVAEEGQMTAHAIVALWRGLFDEFLRDIDDIHSEIGTFAEVAHEVAPPGYDQAVARLEAERLAVADEGAVARAAKGVAQIAGILLVADVAQCVVEDDVLHGFHGQMGKGQVFLRFIQNWRSSGDIFSMA